MAEMVDKVEDGFEILKQVSEISTNEYGEKSPLYKLIRTGRKLSHLKFKDLSNKKICLKLPEIGETYGKAEKIIYSEFVKMADKAKCPFLSIEFSDCLSNESCSSFTYVIKFLQED